MPQNNTFERLFRQLASRQDARIRYQISLNTNSRILGLREIVPDSTNYSASAGKNVTQQYNGTSTYSNPS